MEENIMEVMSKIKNTVLENLNGLMVDSIKVNGSTVNNTVEEITKIQRDKLGMENGQRERELNGTMGLNRGISD